MKKNKYISDQILQFILVFSIVLGIILGINLSYYFFIIPCSTIIAFLIYRKIQKDKLTLQKKEDIKKLWGESHSIDISSKEAQRIYQFLKESNINKFYIDDITWNDLDMGIIYRRINHCMTLPGSQYLYYLLKAPLFSKSKLKERADKISYFFKNRSISQKIQYYLSLAGAGKNVSSNIIWKDQKEGGNKILALYLFLAFLIIPEIVLTIFFPQIGVFVLIASLFINSAVYSINKYKILDVIQEFSYLANIMNCARDLSNLKEAGTNLPRSELESLYSNLKTINRKISSLGSVRDDALDIFNLIFLREPIIFYSAIRVINKYKKDLQRLYLLIGKIDALVAVASYKSGLDYFSSPTLTKNESYLYAKKIYHPLLDDFVSNDFKLKDKGALITGSNASGKSTFLKTIGINIIFAQTLFFTFSKKFKSNFFRVFTSIGTLDNLMTGDSYFMVEAKTIKRIIDSLNDKTSILCILDEIFRGTNTIERISAATQLLNFLANKKCFTVAATHDLELAELVNHKYENYHFREEIIDKDIKFDYILKRGPCRTRNALKILESLGYPEEIYNNSMNMKSNFINGINTKDRK